MQTVIGVVAVAWIAFPMNMRGAETPFTDTMHNTIADIQVILILTSLGLGTIAHGRRFGYYSIATLVTLLAAGFLSFMAAGLSVPQEVGNYFGILERITVHGYMLWAIVLAIVLLQQQNRVG